jgi:hypothetical protein
VIERGEESCSILVKLEIACHFLQLAVIFSSANFAVAGAEMNANSMGESDRPTGGHRKRRGSFRALQKPAFA